MLRPFLLCALVLAAAAADLPEEATIVRSDKDQTLQVWVVDETLDGIVYRLSKDDTNSEATLKRPQIASVRYGSVQDIDLLKGGNSLEKGEFDKAVTSFAAAQGSLYPRYRDLAHIRGAEALLRAKKYDDALKLLAQLEAKRPRSVQLPAANQLRIQVLTEKGDGEGALKAIDALAKIDPVRAAVARAGLLRAKDPAAAAKELQAAWSKAPRTAASDAPTWDSVGFQLAADLVAAKQATEANDVLARLCYGAAEPSSRARAHLQLGKSLSDANDKATLLRALDHALMGGVSAGGDRNGARRLAIAILGKLDKDASFKDESTEYRQYVNAL